MAAQMRTKEIKRQAATFRGKGHVACFSSQSLHAQLTDNGAAAESTKGQGAAELSEGESPSLLVSSATWPTGRGARTRAAGAPHVGGSSRSGLGVGGARATRQSSVENS